MEIRKKGNLWFLVFIYIFFYGCRQNQEKSKILLKLGDKEQNDKIKLSNKVIITGITDDPKAFKYLNFIDYSYFFGTHHKDARQKVFNDSLLLVMRSINQPQIIEFMSFGNNLYNTRIFISPGDSINLIINKGKIQFTGEHEAHYNFFTALENKTQHYYNNPYKGNIDNYKRKIKTIYYQKQEFLTDYLNKNKNISNDFITQVSAELKFEYLYNLIQPRSIKSELGDFYFNNSDGVVSTYSTDYNIEKNEFLNLKEYFDEVSIEDFNMPELINNDYYKRSLVDFIRHYFVETEYLDYTEETFEAEKIFIQKNLDGKLEKYAIGRLINDYYKKGFGIGNHNIVQIKGLIDEYKDQFTEPSYKEKMTEIEESLDNYKFKLSKDALNLTKLLSPVGDTLTLRDVFNSTTGKIKVIDFWTSWCPPCIREIKNGKKFKNKLMNKSNVEWIYLSIDKDRKKWLKKTYELQDFLNTKNQYLILGGKNSTLTKSLKVSGVPRFVIFDKREQIVLDNAPRPSDSLIFKKIIDEINLGKY